LAAVYLCRGICQQIESPDVNFGVGHGSRLVHEF
jgi:hypothetical protein